MQEHGVNYVAADGVRARGVAAARDPFYVHIIRVPTNGIAIPKPLVKLVCSVSLNTLAIQVRMGDNIWPTSQLVQVRSARRKHYRGSFVPGVRPRAN
jgi:hypothetical protein